MSMEKSVACVLSVFLAGREQPLALGFEDRIQAQRAAEALMESAVGYPVTVSAATGHRLTLPRRPQAVLITEPEKEAEFQAEIALLGARAQARLQAKAAADPALRMAQAAVGPRGILRS